MGSVGFVGFVSYVGYVGSVGFPLFVINYLGMLLFVIIYVPRFFVIRITSSRTEKSTHEKLSAESANLPKVGTTLFRKLGSLPATLNQQKHCPLMSMQRV